MRDQAQARQQQQQQSVADRALCLRPPQQSQTVCKRPQASPCKGVEQDKQRAQYAHHDSHLHGRCSAEELHHCRHPAGCAAWSLMTCRAARATMRPRAALCSGWQTKGWSTALSFTGGAIRVQNRVFQCLLISEIQAGELWCWVTRWHTLLVSPRNRLWMWK